MAESPTRFFLQEVTTRVGPLALVTMDNGEEWQKPNVFGSAALASLGELLAELGEQEWRGLVLTGKPFVFAAGADLTEFPRMSTPELARAAAVGGHEAFGAIRDLPFPTLAAINGAAVGGGLEIALHCDYRTVARSVRHIGFPEVFLGIIPGWGGTQLAPRLIGAAAAVELIVANPLKQNRLIDASRAAELGLADALLDDVEFLDDSIEWLVRAIEDATARAGDSRPVRCGRGLREGAVRRRRCRARCRSRPVSRTRADRRIRGVDDRRGLRGGGGRARRPPPRPAGPGGCLRLRPHRAADQEGHRHPRCEAAPDRAGRRRRRRA